MDDPGKRQFSNKKISYFFNNTFSSSKIIELVFQKIPVYRMVKNA